MHPILNNIGYAIRYRLISDKRTISMRAIAYLSDEIHRRIVQKKKELDSHRTLTPDIIKKIEDEMQIEYVYNSNRIEGSELTRGETALVLKGVTVSNRSLDDVLAAQNHPNGMDLIRTMAFDPLHKITEADLKKIHKIIAKGLVLHPGEYRQYDASVIGAGFTPPFHYEIPGHINELLYFINNNPDELSPIELAAHAHYHIAWIHPFENVNGRIARLLLNFILLRNGYPFVVIKNVDRKQYLESLRLADQGELDHFIQYIARCVEQTIDTYLLGIKNRGDITTSTIRSQFLTLAELAKGTPYTAEYLSLLARKGKLDAIKDGKTWRTTRKTIDTYIKQHIHKK